MAIVTMKKLRLMVVRDQKEELLRELALHGCVELSEIGDRMQEAEERGTVIRENSDVIALKTRQAALDQSLSILDRYAPAKTPLLSAKPEKKAAEFFVSEGIDAAEKTAEEIRAAEDRIKRIAAEESRQRSILESLGPWMDLDLPLNTEGTRRTAVTLGSFSARQPLEAVEAALAQAAEEAQLFRVSDDKSQQYVVLVCMKEAQAAALEALRPFGFTPSAVAGMDGTARECAEKASGTLKALDDEKNDCARRIRQAAESREDLQMASDRLGTRLALAGAGNRLYGTENVLMAEGWFPADKEKQVSSLLNRFDCAYEFSDPTEEEIPDVPVKLKGNLFTRSMNCITEQYSLPAYNGVDPNPIMAPFFILFFGMMMADMAYGILMIAGSLIFLKKKRPADRSFMEMIFWCGISTFIFGALTGGFFGDFIPQLCRIINPNSTFELPSLFTPLNDTMPIMIGSLALGLIQIFTGMGVSAVKKIKDGHFPDALWEEFTWWVILAGVALMVLKIGTVHGVPVVLVIGGLMLVYGSTRNARGFGKVTSLVAAIYNGVTGYFSDTLSYVRIMALMLSGSVIAQVFNTLGATFGNVILFVIISMIGNMLNLALNLLGCYVHDMRLQFLEFFNRFYQAGGKAYQPLTPQTKYMQVIKEEN